MNYDIKLSKKEIKALRKLIFYDIDYTMDPEELKLYKKIDKKLKKVVPHVWNWKDE